MTDDQLFNEFVRIRVTPERIFLEVKTVTEASEVFSERWVLAAALRRPATPLDVARARLRVLADYRHFRACDACGEKLPSGMFVSEFDEPDLCPDCRGD